MAHPDLVLLADRPQAVEQCRGGDDVDEGPAELALVRSDHLPAQLLVERLLAVADAEEGQAAFEEDFRRSRAALLDDRRRSARKDDALGLEPPERFLGSVERRDFRVDAGLADAPGDELRHLAAEVDDENGFAVTIVEGWVVMAGR